MKTELYNKKAEKVGTIDLPDRVFAVRWNPQLVHQALNAQVSNARDVLAHTKGRGEVSGGGKKPWKQKHTGRARHASIRSPIWKGGGVAHGPTKDRNFSKKINKKMRQAAIFSVLSKRLKDGEVKFIDSLTFDKPKTKLATDFLKGFLKSSDKDVKTVRINALIVPDQANRDIYRATRNIQNVKSLNPNALNVYDLLKYRNIILDKEAIAVIDKNYSMSATKTNNS